VQLALDWRGLVPPARNKKRQESAEPFGPRLARLRQARGLTQEELGATVGLSNRMVAYYERGDAQAPGPVLAALASALKVSTDELLGLRPIKDGTSPKTARLLKRLKRVEDLAPADQRAVLKIVDGLLAARQRSSRP
jgi:transcriptional regulator with XRE-family HTH domain